MLNKDKIERSQVEFFSIDDFVPQDHLLKKNRFCIRFY